jgi:hypothetical protein
VNQIHAKNAYLANKAITEPPKKKVKVKQEFDVTLKDEFAEKNRRLVSKQPDPIVEKGLNIIDSESDDDED